MAQAGWGTGREPWRVPYGGRTRRQESAWSAVAHEQRPAGLREYNRGSGVNSRATAAKRPAVSGHAHGRERKRRQLRYRTWWRALSLVEVNGP